MSKILYACFRGAKPTIFSTNNIKSLSKRLEPDNITFSPPKVIEDKGLEIAIFNPNDSISINTTSVCLGVMISTDSNWWEPKSRIPDGSYALFRSNDKHIEVISDIVASRTIWYYYDDNIFISSTSQRAIIFFLKSFEFNKLVIPWMLATGSLGPGYSWDKRLRVLKGNSSISLDRSIWAMTIETQEHYFRPIIRSKKNHQEELTQALTETFKSLNLDYSKWILPLSGGYDSRIILCMLKEVEELECVTWGLEKSQFKKGNDGFIAKKLAKHFGKKYKYLLTDFSDEPIAKIFNRFLVCGEGRFDDISGYMDGFKIWKDLFEKGINGIIRGDEGFGWKTVSSEQDLRLKIGIPLLSDFANLRNIYNLGIHRQDIPDWVNKRNGECIESWRDRLYHQFRIPFILAALNDLKLSYIEITNPLLSKKIIEVVKGLPDSLRTNKKLFRKIVKSIGPDIPIAKYDAIASLRNIMQHKKVVDEIKNELSLEYAHTVLPPEFINYVLANIKTIEYSTVQRGAVIKKYIKRLLPKKIKNLLRNTVVKPTLDFNELAYRSYIICKMNKILKDDTNISS